MRPPRLRVFAGPNGSGKSTLYQALPSFLVGVYVNADEIERQLRDAGGVDLSAFGLERTTAEARASLASSSLVQHFGLLPLAEAAEVSAEGRLSFPGHDAHPYLAALVADLVRRELLADGASFTFETVMSSRDKVDLMADARARGYHVDLYYVTTVDPSINIARVASRVAQDGHPVPADKVVSRYTRSLENLAAAIRQSDRAYLYDNSGRKAVLVGEVTGGRAIAVKVEKTVPQWFMRYVWAPLHEGNEAGGP